MNSVRFLWRRSRSRVLGTAERHGSTWSMTTAMAMASLAMGGCPGFLPPEPADTDAPSDTASGTTMPPGSDTVPDDDGNDTDSDSGSGVVTVGSVGDSGIATDAETSGSTSDPSGSTSDTGGSTGDTGDTDSETDSETEGDTDSGGPDPDPPAVGCEADCVVGCQEVVLAPLVGTAELWHSADGRLALDAAGLAVLWPVVDDSTIARFEGIAAAALEADIFGLESGGFVSVRSTVDATELGVVDVTDAQWGLARDGSYVWVADAVGLRVFETDGTLRWEQAGDYEDAQVLAISTSVHVQSSAVLDSVEAIDAMTGLVTTTGFTGTFGGWFYDQPRFWTETGEAFRLYDTDGTQLAFAIGSVRHGYGDWIVFGGSGASVASVADVETIIETVSWSQISGAAILGSVDFGEATLLRLDEPALVPQTVPMPCCDSGLGGWNFAYGDERWMVSGADGLLFDDQSDALATGEIDYVHGSASGTFAASTAVWLTSFWEVSATCVLDSGTTIERRSRPGLISGDGSTFLSVTNTPQISVDLWDVSAGTVFDTVVTGLSTSTHTGMQVSDAADLFGLQSVNTGFHSSSIREYPGFVVRSDGAWAQTPAVSPGGVYSAYNDTQSAGINPTFEGSLSYVHDDAGLVAIFDGVVKGFVDDTTMLVAHYEFVGCPFASFTAGECDGYLGSDLVDENGLVIAAAPIPDPSGFERVSATEVFLPSPPTIIDVYTGAVEWSGPAGPAAPVGLDHVLHMEGDDLVLTKWR